MAYAQTINNKNVIFRKVGTFKSPSGNKKLTTTVEKGKDGYFLTTQLGRGVVLSSRKNKDEAIKQAEEDFKFYTS